MSFEVIDFHLCFMMMVHGAGVMAGHHGSPPLLSSMVVTAGHHGSPRVTSCTTGLCWLQRVYDGYSGFMMVTAGQRGSARVTTFTTLYAGYSGFMMVTAGL